MNRFGYSAARSFTALQKIGQWRAAPGCSLFNAVVVKTLQGPQLWVNRDLNSYREVWNRTFPKEIPGPGEDIDHIFPRSWARPLNYIYIRLAIVESGPNRSAGASWEKVWANLYRTPETAIPREQPDLYPLEHLQWVKLRNIKPGGRRNAYEGARNALRKGRTT